MSKITYREYGSGSVLLLLHGYGGSVHHWEGVVDNLKSQYHVVVPNMTHLYMSSEKIVFSKQVEQFAEFIKTHFPNQKVSIAGISYGGAICWALSLLHPELIEKQLLINPMLPSPVNQFTLSELRYFFSIPLNVKSIYFLLSSPVGKVFLKKAAQIFRDERTHGSVNIDTLKGRKLQFVAMMIHHFSWILRTADWALWTGKMKLARTETLLIYDREDLLFDRNAYLEFSKIYHCDKLIELTGAGHIATKARPESIARYMSDFLQNISVAS